MQGLVDFVDWTHTASLSDLTSLDMLKSKIASVGLYHDNRKSPIDPSMSIYGDDVKYMLPRSSYGSGRAGIWQTPEQLASFLLCAGQYNIKTYLDIGTFSGWTITIVVAYLKRFGLERADTYDVNKFLDDSIARLWTEKGLPITYYLKDIRGILEKYDFVFIDGDHDKGVFIDFENYKDRAKMLGFHDINDAFCPMVVKCWQDVRARYADKATFYEFTQHPNNFRLMGIGMMVWN